MPQFQNLSDDELANRRLAYDAGVYNYQTVLGSGATVRLFDYDYPKAIDMLMPK